MNNQTQSRKGKRFGVMIALCAVLAITVIIAQWRPNETLVSSQPVPVETEEPGEIQLQEEPASTSSEEREKVELLRLRNEVRQLREQVAQPKVTPNLQVVASAQATPSPTTMIQRSELTPEWRGMEQLAVTNYVRALDRLTNARSRIEGFHALGDAAKLSFAFGKTEDAQNYAVEMLTLAEKFKDEIWSGRCGQAIHDGNLVLGRIALEQGAIEDAKLYLLQAGTSSGSPVLGSFGPNMSLARELLEKGERDTVLQYFDLCRNFWKSEKLNQWSAEVNAGQSPKFGANLIY
jgi:hypothetical protein